MSCKNCVKRGIAGWLAVLGLVSLILSIVVGLIGTIAVWVHSWDGYDFEEHGYVTHSMNWIAFSIFAGLFICGITTVLWWSMPDEEVQDC